MRPPAPFVPTGRIEMTEVKERKGKRYLSGFESIKYVVRPSFSKRDDMGFVENTPALRAVFKDHKFDSGLAQETYGWTDEERERVEQYLERHQDWGRVDTARLYLDQSVKQVVPVEEDDSLPPTPVGVPKLKCLHFVEAGPDTIQCDNEALEGDELCKTHADARDAEKSLV